MLNEFFAFGVPTFLIVLYLGFSIFRKKSTVPYLGIVLFIISGFLSVFSFQVLQQAFTEIQATSEKVVEQTYGYPFFLLYIPLAVGLLLVFLNIYRGYRKLRNIRTHTK
ncbi:MAG TPA: hypothetical protein H9829_10455 [Candidatus Tetragenococcus pullicola]|nr:hypothetical protein [Candidatus Tetragenococcus pullicola]